MAAQTWRNLTFKDVFWKFSLRWLIQRKVKKKKTVFITFLDLRDWWF